MPACEVQEAQVESIFYILFLFLANILLSLPKFHPLHLDFVRLTLGKHSCDYVCVVNSVLSNLLCLHEGKLL